MYKKHTLKGLTVLGLLFVMTKGQSQMHNNGHLFVDASTTCYLDKNNFSFGILSVIKTEKGDPNGAIAIGSNATIAIGTNDLFVDGWVKSFGSGIFNFPIGQTVSTTNYYAPIVVTPGVISTGVSAAYFRDNTTSIGSTLDSDLLTISETEYWKIIGSNSSISLTWNSTSGLNLTQIANVTIAGYNTSSNSWEVIPSQVDLTSVIGGITSVTSGSVSSTEAVVLNNYSAFSIGTRGIICPQLIYTVESAISYNGNLFSAIPTLSDVVTINSSGNTGSFSCNSLVLNADITLTGNEYIEVVNGISGIGKIIMSSESSLVQRASGVSKPNIELTKATRLIHRYDYVYWGAPIEGDVFSQLSLAKASTATVADAFEMKYKYVSGIGGGWQNLTETATGVGFIARAKSQAPFTTSIAEDYINFKFTGVANNGDITVPVVNNPNNLNGGTSHNLLANPYPSALDADKFLEGNTGIDGVVYIWKQQTPSFGVGIAYGQADYIAYTRAGSTSSTSVPNLIPFLGKIASGQGFLVKALGTEPTVTFTNCMRLIDNNTSFNRASEATVMDRYKVNMFNSTGVFSQIVVSYLPEGTLGYDRMYDAGRNSVSTAQLFSILDEDGRKLAINARPTFINTDVVKIGVSKKVATDEIFTLSIQEKEGVFETGVSVFVHDLVLDTYTDLTLSDYTFSTNTTLLTNRFELVYLNGTLDNATLQNSNALAYIDKGVLSISASLEMKNIEVYDLLGRKVITLSPEGSKTATSLFSFSEGIYIAKITLENGVIVTNKLVNKN